MTQYPTTEQERQMLIVTATGLNRKPKHNDIRPDRTLTVKELDRGNRVLSTLKGDVDDIIKATLWLDRYGFEPAVMNGVVVY